MEWMVWAVVMLPLPLPLLLLPAFIIVVVVVVVVTWTHLTCGRATCSGLGRLSKTSNAVATERSRWAQGSTREQGVELAGSAPAQGGFHGERSSA
jgi:uncharacterized membrane protein